MVSANRWKRRKIRNNLTTRFSLGYLKRETTTTTAKAVTFTQASKAPFEGRVNCRLRYRRAHIGTINGKEQIEGQSRPPFSLKRNVVLVNRPKLHDCENPHTHYTMIRGPSSSPEVPIEFSIEIVNLENCTSKD